MKDESAEKEKNLQSIHEQQLTELKNTHEKTVVELKEKSEASLSKMKDELNLKSLQEQEKLSSEKDEIIKTKESELAKFQRLYEEISNRVETLSGQVQESEVGLGSASSKISRLNEMLKGKQAEVNSLETDLASSRTLADSLKVCSFILAATLVR